MEQPCLSKLHFLFCYWFLSHVIWEEEDWTVAAGFLKSELPWFWFSQIANRIVILRNPSIKYKWQNFPDKADATMGNHLTVAHLFSSPKTIPTSLLSSTCSCSIFWVFVWLAKDTCIRKLFYSKKNEISVYVLYYMQLVQVACHCY